MKRMVIITEISVVLLLMLLALSGCGSRREKADEATTGLTAGAAAGMSGDSTGQPGDSAGQSGDLTGQSTADTQSSPDTDDVPLALDALQGHWVDVNGDTTLDVDGDQMIIRCSSV